MNREQEWDKFVAEIRARLDKENDGPEDLPRLLDEAIGLFIEYETVHGYSRERARGAAILEVLQGLGVEDEIGLQPEWQACSCLDDIRAFCAENHYPDGVDQYIADVWADMLTDGEEDFAQYIEAAWEELSTNYAAEFI